MKMMKNNYLNSQIITYLGNKRGLLNFISKPIKYVQKELGKDELTTLDLFSGSGIVARYFKTFAAKVYANDMQGYSNTINHCYLINKDEFEEELLKYYYELVKGKISSCGTTGFISEMYCPADDLAIKENERTFYTNRNGKFIDAACQALKEVPEPYHSLLKAPLLSEVSSKTNTNGQFKSFYKNTKTNRGQFGGDGQNALARIMADIELELPVLCDRTCEYEIFQEDANQLVRHLPEVDLAYLDPPYNQHPYSSCYHLLNTINEYQKPSNVSKVSGIPENWKRSQYNSKTTAFNSLKDLVENTKAKYILISFNDDGFISVDEMTHMLSALGEVKTFNTEYDTFKGSRNLKNRKKKVREYLYLLKKDGEIRPSVLLNTFLLKRKPAVFPTDGQLHS